MPTYDKRDPDKGAPNPRRDDLVERFARSALEAFRADMPEAHAELTKAYEGSAVAAGVFGLGMVVVAVKDGEVHINPEPSVKTKMLGRGAAYPETIAALATGRLTVLEAYHKGDIAVQASKSDLLHDGYNRMVRYSDAALRSTRLQKVFAEFCKATGIEA